MKVPFADNRIDYIFNLLEPSKKDRVLVIGVSNIPEIEIKFENLVKECFIIDIDSKKLKNASKFLKKSKFILGDITKKVNIPRGYFNKIIILEVLEHLEDDYAALIRLNAMLCKGGSIIIAVPNNSFLHIINPLKYTQHKRHYSNEQIKKLVERAGFSINHFNVTENWSMFFNLYVHLFFKFLLRKNKQFLTLKKIPGNTYKKFNKNGLDIIISAIKK